MPIIRYQTGVFYNIAVPGQEKLPVLRSALGVRRGSSLHDGFFLRFRILCVSGFSIEVVVVRLVSGEAVVYDASELVLGHFWRESCKCFFRIFLICPVFLPINKYGLDK
jgi:hypothetical protein